MEAKTNEGRHLYSSLSVSDVAQRGTIANKSFSEGSATSAVMAFSVEVCRASGWRTRRGHHPQWPGTVPPLRLRRPFQSARSETVGSTRVARRAGMYVAASAVAATTVAATI